MTKKGESFKPSQRLNGVLIASKLFIILLPKEKKKKKRDNDKLSSIISLSN